MTKAVCDSGPLTHLWQIDRWSVFRTFQEICLATLVVQEVRAHVPLDQFESLTGLALLTFDVPTTEMESCRKALPPDLMLERADLATLTLARQVTPELVLTDDLTLRRAVEIQGQVPMGSVGILLRAYKAGQLDTQSLDQAIDGLFVHSTLYLSPIFKSHVKRQIAQITGRLP